MKSLEYSQQLVSRLGKDKAIESLEEAISNWKIKKKAPQIHPTELCNRTISYFKNCIEHII